VFSVITPLKEETKRSISTVQVVKLMKTIEIVEENEDQKEIINDVVKFKDWIKLFSYGIGNFWEAISIII